MHGEIEEEIPMSKSPNIGGIVYFGCKWRVATDDLVLPAWIEAFFRLIGSIVILGVYLSEYKITYIQHYNIAEYLIGYEVLCILICAILVLMAINSMQGYIWDERPNVRAFVVPLLYVNIVFVVGEIIWLIYGTYNIHRAWNNVDNIIDEATVKAQLTTTLVVIILSWIGMFFKLFLSFVFFKKSMRGKTLTKHLYNQFTTRSFRIIGDSISFFFHDPDFVPTDTAAALFLLDLYRKNHSTEKPALSTNIPEGFNYSDIEHYAKYSSSMYGFLHLPLLKKTGSFIRIFGKGICCCCFKERVEVEGPPCSCFNLFAVFNELPFLNSDSFHFVNFNNEITVTPYIFVVDEERRKIVIAIRGSMSLYDAMTDLLLTTDPIDGYDHYYTHRGFLESARRIHAELLDKGILQRALDMSPGYEIVVTGHSLGAGVAVVLTFLLRLQYTSTTCYAFSCPLCLNELARIESEKFVVHVIYGDDVFPRLTPKNFALLVNQMRHILRHSKIPKYKILGLNVFSSFFKQMISIEDTLLLSSSSEDIIPQKVLMNRYIRKHSTVLDLSLSLPGRILHITKDQNEYYIQEVSHAFFSQIEISPRMMLDHLPINLLTALEAIKARSLNN